MAGTRKTRVLHISLSPEIYEEVDRLSREQAMGKSKFVRQVLRQHIASARRWKQIRAWGKETARKSGIKGEGDVEGIIEEYRRESSA